MKPKLKIKTKRPRKKQGAGVEISEGPFDSYNHSLKTKQDRQLEIDNMERKQQYFQAAKSYHQNKYNEALQHKDAINQADAAVKESRRAEEHAVKMQNEAIQSQAVSVASEKASSSMLKFFHFMKEGVKFVGALIKGGWTAARNTGTGIHNTFGRNEVLARIVGAFCALIIIALLVVFLYFVISGAINLATRVDNAGKPEQCTSISNEIIISIKNVHLMDQLNALSDKIDDFYKPKFEAVKEFTDKNIVSFFKNPTSYASDWLKFWQDKILNSEPLRSILLTLEYISKLVVVRIQAFTGGGTAYMKYSRTAPRELLTTGRSDNIYYVDSDIFPRPLLRNKGINGNDTVVNLEKPLDIKWELPKVEYDGHDISKLPPALVTKKDENNVSLEDKGTIIIPWISKNNNYVLSCKDAYFAKNINEKANIFIDIDDFTCTYNDQSTPEVFQEDKKRYASQKKDLSILI